MTVESDGPEKLILHTAINGIDDRAAEDADQSKSNCLPEPIKESLEGQLVANADTQIAGNDEQELDDAGWLCL